MKIITGMHRSGTSIVARLMLEAGGDFGDPDTFYRPDKWNPDGYYEQPEFHAINMPIINGPFWKLSYFHLPSTKTLTKRAAKFSDEIRAASDKYRGKVVKEVRFCLTLPGWIEQGAYFERALVCLREPLEVAQSVDKRFRIGYRRSLELWRLHNERLLENLGDLPRWFIAYHDVLNPETRHREVSAALEFFGLDRSEPTLERLSGLIRSPRHSVDVSNRIDYPGRVRELWDHLLELHEAQFATEARHAAQH